ncbi:MAG: hypothetical protein LBK76_09910 [Verrucomicrobiales bacterium]|jgi:predicted XRE-type DNA-binding protein|nr:hypothetical protein [Verrucomicrobiales bacterium]
MADFLAFEEGARVLATDRTALTELLRADNGADAEQVAARLEIFYRLLDFFLLDGERPRTVAARVYAVAWAVDHAGFRQRFSQARVARLLGEQRATMSHRIKAKINKFLIGRGAKALTVRGQHAASASARCRAAQLNNHNRRGGKIKT